MDDTLATPRERLVCLRAYRRASPRLGRSWWTILHGIEKQTRRLLTRRHIQENGNRRFVGKRGFAWKARRCA